MLTERCMCYGQWGSAACHSKANEEARLVESKICFVSDASNQQEWTSVQRPPPHHWQSVNKSFYRQRKADTCRNSTGSSDSHVEIVLSGLTCVILIILCTVNLQFQGWVWFSELWQLMSQLQPGHHVVHVFHLVRVSVSINKRQLTGYGS